MNSETLVLPISLDQLTSIISSSVHQAIDSRLEQKTSAAPDEFMTIDQASGFLNLSKATIYSFVQKKQIPVSKKGKKLYFSKNDLTQWVKEGAIEKLNENEGCHA